MQLRWAKALPMLFKTLRKHPLPLPPLQQADISITYTMMPRWYAIIYIICTHILATNTEYHTDASGAEAGIFKDSVNNLAADALDHCSSGTVWYWLYKQFFDTKDFNYPCPLTPTSKKKCQYIVMIPPIISACKKGWQRKQNSPIEWDHLPSPRNGWLPTKVMCLAMLADKWGRAATAESSLFIIMLPLEHWIIHYHSLQGMLFDITLFQCYK